MVSISRSAIAFLRPPIPDEKPKQPTPEPPLAQLPPAQEHSEKEKSGNSVVPIEPGAFRRRVTHSTPVDYEIKALDQLGVSYKVYAEIPPRHGIKRPYKSLHVVFPNLKESEFQKLKSHFGAGIPKAFQRGQFYRLTDFISPVASATYHNTFFESESKGLKLTTNCFSTVYEYIRARNIFDTKGEPSSEMAAFYPDHTKLLSLLFDSKYSQPVLFGRDKKNPSFDVPKEADDASLTKTLDAKLRPDDVLVLYRKQYQGDPSTRERYAAHTMVYLGNGLFFEKVGPNDDDPYRVVGPGRLKHWQFEVRRFNRTELPPPSEIVDEDYGVAKLAYDKSQSLVRFDSRAYLDTRAGCPKLSLFDQARNAVFGVPTGTPRCFSK